MEPTALPALEALIRGAARAAAAPDPVDWTLPAAPPPGVDRRDYVDMVSQLHHSEIAALAVLERLRRELPEEPARRFLAAQVREEVRHAEMYADYAGRLGGLVPVDDALRRTFEAGLGWKGHPGALVLALHGVMESESLQQQARRAETLPCPLFRQINLRILRDEARHARFGEVYLRDRIPRLPAGERFEMLGWMMELWTAWERSNENRYSSPGSAVLRTDSVTLASRRERHRRFFERIGLQP